MTTAVDGGGVEETRTARLVLWSKQEQMVTDEKIGEAHWDIDAYLWKQNPSSIGVEFGTNGLENRRLSRVLELATLFNRTVVRGEDPPLVPGGSPRAFYSLIDSRPLRKRSVGKVVNLVLKDRDGTHVWVVNFVTMTVRLTNRLSGYRNDPITFLNQSLEEYFEMNGYEFVPGITGNAIRFRPALNHAHNNAFDGANLKRGELKYALDNGFLERCTCGRLLVMKEWKIEGRKILTDSDVETERYWRRRFGGRK